MRTGFGALVMAMTAIAIIVEYQPAIADTIDSGGVTFTEMQSERSVDELMECHRISGGGDTSHESPCPTNGHLQQQSASGVPQGVDAGKDVKTGELNFIGMSDSLEQEAPSSWRPYVWSLLIKGVQHVTLRVMSLVSCLIVAVVIVVSCIFVLGELIWPETDLSDRTFFKLVAVAAAIMTFLSKDVVAVGVLLALSVLASRAVVGDTSHRGFRTITIVFFGVFATVFACRAPLAEVLGYFAFVVMRVVSYRYVVGILSTLRGKIPQQSDVQHQGIIQHQGNVQHQRIVQRQVKVAQINASLRAYKTKLRHLQDEIAARTRSTPMRIALVGLSICTEGLSKIFQIPYDLKIAKEKRELRKKFKRIQLEAADVYYGAGSDTHGIDKFPADLRMEKASWKRERRAILNRFKDAVKHGARDLRETDKFLGLINDASESGTPISELMQELGIDTVVSAYEGWVDDMVEIVIGTLIDVLV